MGIFSPKGPARPEKDERSIALFSFPAGRAAGRARGLNARLPRLFPSATPPGLRALRYLFSALVSYN